MVRSAVLAMVRSAVVLREKCVVLDECVVECEGERGKALAGGRELLASSDAGKTSASVTEI